MNTGIPTIRPASAEDIQALSELSHRTIRASYSPFLGEKAVEAYLVSGMVTAFIRKTIDNCTVILQGKQIAGFCVVDGSLVDLLMIDYPKQRRGLGRILLSAVVTELFKEHDRLALESFEANQTADRFYRRQGWVEAGKFWDEESGRMKITFIKHKTEFA